MHEVHSPSSHSDRPLAEQTLGSIAARLPGATAVFRRYKLDFCCGGNVDLASAVARKQLSLPEVEQELQRLKAPVDESVPTTTAALVDHILARYHEVHRRELPELIRLARRVEAVHRDHPEAPLGLADALEEMQEALDVHMQKEEQILFPMFLRSNHLPSQQPIAVMRFEHDEHGERLRALEALAHGAVAPADACPTWRALYSGIRKLVDDVMEHIHLENNVLFPRYVAVPTPAASH